MSPLVAAAVLCWLLVMAVVVGLLYAEGEREHNRPEVDLDA